MVATALAKRQHRKEISAFFTLAVGVFLALCLISYDPADPALNVSSDLPMVTNLGGKVGAYLADFSFFVFGVSAYMLVGVCFLISALLFIGRQVHLNWKQLLAYSIMIFSAAAILHAGFGTVLIQNQPIEAGGLIGGMLGEVFIQLFGLTGTYILGGTICFLAFMYATRLSMVNLAKWMICLVRVAAITSYQYSTRLWGRLCRHLPKLLRALAGQWSRWQTYRANRQMQKLRRKKTKSGPKIRSSSPSNEANSVSDYVAPIAAQTACARRSPEGSSQAPRKSTTPKITERHDTNSRRLRNEQLELAHLRGQYTLPSLGLLDSPPPHMGPIDETDLRRQASMLEKKLAEFGILGRVSEIHPGPVVTMYEYEPAAGIKVNRITGSADDLSVAMGGRSIRIVPHLPGKAAVGIEIPNLEREIVYLKEILSDNKFRKSSTKLPLAMGKNIGGTPVIADLTKMPHLLVAGATGAGKSVAINAMICSILYKSSPEEVRMILVDPKMLELSIYDGIPHLLLPVVTKPKDATTALRWAVREMERRYRLLSDAGVRNILGYNSMVEREGIELTSQEEADARLAADPDAICHTGKMPFIVIVIDEMSDLMMIASREMETYITRLAQMARASGIHLILATQRPSVDVITGLIKANFPSRVSFKVSSKHDSRTIIDTVGAEHLLGSGDMLFMAPSASSLIRLHGAYVTEHEISHIVDHVKSQSETRYDESILHDVPELTSNSVEGDQDELYDQAVHLVSKNGQASISMVQRRLRIGYNRAARLIERMEHEGVVGPADGSKPRRVMVQEQ